MASEFFERPQSGERAVLVHASPDGLPDASEREEFAELARSAGAELVDEIVSSRRAPDPRNFIGKGKLGTEMPAWEKVLEPQQIADLSEYVFTAFIHP